MYRVSVSSHERSSNVGRAVWETVKSQTRGRLSNRHASVDEQSSVLLNKMIIGHGTQNDVVFRTKLDFHLKCYCIG